MKKLIMFWVVVVFISMTPPVMAQESVQSNKSASDQHPGGVESLEERIKQLEEAVERQVEGKKWYDRIQISGLVEVEAGYGKTDFKEPAADDEKTSDVDLATVELVMDVRIVDHADGHVLFKYEDNEVFVDEGFITLKSAL